MSPPKSADPAEPPIAVLLGLPFHDLTMSEALDECRLALTANRPVYFVTANVDFAAQAYENASLRKILFYAKRVVCDGMPLIWISKVLGHPLRERVAGSDLTPKLLEICVEMNKRVYFFGSDDQTLAEVAEILSERMPNLKIAGYESPPMGKVQDWDNEAVVQRIKASGADLLLVALGCPKQEDWIYLFHQRAGAALSIGIGASLDFVSGKQVRAPGWMQSTGLEWLWRMGTNPKRLFSRYFRDFLFLGWVTMKQLLTKRRQDLPAPESPTHEPPAEVSYRLIRWRGSVERATMDELEQPEDWSQPLLLDLSGVEFMDSGGMGALAGLARKAKEADQVFAVLKPSDTVMNVLKAVRLDSLFQFYASEVEFSAGLMAGEPVSKGEEVLHFQLAEWYDKSNVDELNARLCSLIDGQPAAYLLLVDCSKITFIDSSGVTALLVARRRLLERGGGVKIIAPTPPMRRILNVLCLEEFLPEHSDGKAGN
ncbi:WecB/TagA/CpsF family glycosyltransferase [Cerasicoccus frondis]|uniref:WecB/TagA/CpsF family glycosyltransferase n=1 Tax=Cerasicoccus frondis TaxID=490090 RepID=UPI002852750B|nr:WecB/TagA/CpsF family glycosyltransferase [Cerasicoccus frondis]